MLKSAIKLYALLFLVFEANSAVAETSSVEDLKKRIAGNCSEQYAMARDAINAHPVSGLVTSSNDQGETTSWDAFWLSVSSEAKSSSKSDDSDGHDSDGFLNLLNFSSVMIAQLAPVGARLELNSGNWPSPDFADVYSSFTSLSGCIRDLQGTDALSSPLPISGMSPDTWQCYTALNLETVQGYRRIENTDLSDWDRMKVLRKQLAEFKERLGAEQNCMWGFPL